MPSPTGGAKLLWGYPLVRKDRMLYRLRVRKSLGPGLINPVICLKPTESFDDAFFNR